MSADVVVTGRLEEDKGCEVVMIVVDSNDDDVGLLIVVDIVVVGDIGA
jgi:hypothetical protein